MLQPQATGVRNPNRNSGDLETHTGQPFKATSGQDPVFPSQQSHASLPFLITTLFFICFPNYSSCVTFFPELFPPSSEIWHPKQLSELN